MRFEKGEKKKKFGQSAKGRIEPLVDRIKKILLVIYHLRHWSWCFSWLCCASFGSSCTLIDRCLVQSAVSNLFPNQWRCLKLYLPLPVCLICRCVFWLVVLFLDLSLCFLICYFVFYICICVCNLLFCFQNCDLFCTYRPPYIHPIKSKRQYSDKQHAISKLWLFWIIILYLCDAHLPLMAIKCHFELML